LPTYTVTPNTCTDKPTLSIHPLSNNSQAAPSYITAAIVSGSWELKVASSAAADVTAETEYTIKATAPGGTVVDTTATFKLTMKLACLTAIAVNTNPVKDIVYYINTSSA
jgi:hypothetical protein